jgi:hypothetical protein
MHFYLLSDDFLFVYFFLKQMWQIIRLFSTSLKCDHWSKTSVFIMLMPLDRRKVQQHYLKGKSSFCLLN